MKIRKLPLNLALITGAAILTLSSLARAQHQHDPSDHASHGQASSADARTLVEFPPQMRLHTLASMRDHLLALSEIHEALAKGAYEKASDLAEQRLGMSSLKEHGAHEQSKFMPQGMQDIGTSMHHAASRFAIEAKNASVTNDLKPSLEALSGVTKACVACHSGYRLH